MLLYISFVSTLQQPSISTLNCDTIRDWIRGGSAFCDMKMIEPTPRFSTPTFVLTSCK